MLRDIRTNYQKSELTEDSVIKDPFKQLNEWLNAAIKEGDPEPNAMVLSTIDLKGYPDSRVVLLKELNSEGLIFFTNYNSKKGRQISVNPNVSIVFFWPETQRQVRIKGKAEKIPDEYSEEYFKSRPVESQLGAWASPQSRIIESREVLDENYSLFQQYFQDNEILKPAHWGGFIIRPVNFEFWQGRLNRLHDRFEFCLSDHEWIIHRLAP
ncbi:MAG TPA: pyridoxamine 5'-phosphate oxidase [Prolixibacteraceae bacterium]|nr:pyridoxamine 5'-phosphate oxidase [Prolixibacteraceae bacterium]